MRCCPSQADHAWASLRLQLSRCCSNMALCHRACHSVPQCSTQVPTGGSSSSPAPLWVPLQGLQLQPQAAPMGGCPWTVPLPGLISCCTKSVAAGGDVLYPWTAGGNGLLHHGSLLSCKKFLLCAFITSCPSFCTDLGACRVCFSHISYSSLPAAQQFSPFLNLLSQRHTQCHSWLNSGQQWVPFRASWSWLLPMLGLFLELPHL